MHQSISDQRGRVLSAVNIQCTVQPMSMSRIFLAAITGTVLKGSSGEGACRRLRNFGDVSAQQWATVTSECFNQKMVDGPSLAQMAELNGKVLKTLAGQLLAISIASCGHKFPKTRIFSSQLTEKSSSKFSGYLQIINLLANTRKSWKTTSPVS